MHSSDPLPPPPATGPTLLQALGRLIIRGRSTSPATRAPSREQQHQKGPGTCRQIQTQPLPKSEPEEQQSGLEAQLDSRVDALWNEHIPICIEVFLAPDCQKCFETLRRVDGETFERAPTPRGLLLERWTIRAIANKAHESSSFISSQWLLSAVRSQLHFSQLSAWAARLNSDRGEDVGERRRKLSRETCNFKKLESNCDNIDTSTDRQLNIVYNIKIPGETYKMADYTKTLNDHTFPLTDMGSNVYLKVVLESLPRTNEIPIVKCACKRRTSKDIPKTSQDELVGKLIDLNLGKFDVNSNAGTSRRPSISNADFKYVNDKEKGIVDDRMHTTCSENGKHRCNCDEESDANVKNQPKKLDDRRLKEIAKYKRRIRKENKLRKHSNSTSSDGGDSQKSQTTSIPILQAAKFDRFRAIGCYRNQTYLTLPASRIDCKSPFLDSVNIPPAEFKKTVSVSTQTDDLNCQCGNTLTLKCEDCKGMVRSDANYNLASINADNDKTEAGIRRKIEADDTVSKKQKCDFSFNLKQCDNLDDSEIVNSELIKRPTMRRGQLLVDKIHKVVDDRQNQTQQSKRQKTFSIGDDDYVLYEKCDYGTIDRCEIESPSEEIGFKFPEPVSPEDENKIVDAVPTPTEVDKFRWRFDSAASMVFHTKTGLPLTSSPAPLRRSNNCFDFDDSINGISGIKSALFHVESPAPPPPPRPQRPLRSRPRLGPSGGLLGSFEESALKGRLEPVATVHGFAAVLAASGAFCPPHRRLPVAVFFYAPGGTNAPYMGHINLGPGGYRVARSGTIQVSLFNPHGTLVKMFVVLYDLTSMPPMARTFLRQRTLYMPAGSDPPAPQNIHKWLRYLIHLRFMTSKSGKLYLHTDIRILVSRKADVDTATAHSALFRPLSANHSAAASTPTNQSGDSQPSSSTSTNRAPNRVFGGSSEHDSEMRMREIGYENQNGLSFELRSFTYAPDNPKYSPR